MNLKEQLAAALKAARDIAERAKSDSRSLTDDERNQIEAKLAEVDDLKAKIQAAEQSDGLMAKIAGLGGDDDHHDEDGDAPAAKSLGDLFAKSVTPSQLSTLKSRTGFSVSTPEFKAASDAHTTAEVFGPVLTQVDTNVVRGYRRPTVASLFGQGTLSGTGITYFVEAPTVEGGPTTVGEAGQKPQLHVPDPTPVTETLKKIAAWWDVSDEMVEDVQFWVSEINNRALYLLSLEEENQILNGSGSGTDLAGLLGRDGVQTQDADGTPADAIFRAGTKVQTATGLNADAVVINPADYQDLRLAKDGNGQYYGGGFFAGQYGNGGVPEQPPVWGMQTVVSAAAPVGTAVVGAYKVGATVYRKGGIRVESTNSDRDKFTKDIITNRIEERLALAVRIPAAFVKVSLTAEAPAE